MFLKGPGKPEALPPGHYQGYETAFFAPAAYIHPKAGPGGKPGLPKVRGRYYAGGGGGGGGYQQQWRSPQTQQLHYCEVCKISCASKLNLNTHIRNEANYFFKQAHKLTKTI